MRSRRVFLLVATLSVAAVGVGTMIAWEPRGENAVALQGKEQGGAKGATADEAAIRKSAADFTKAFNAADAKAVWRFWTQDGEYLQADGEQHKGRDVIEKDFALFFKNNPKATLEIDVQISPLDRQARGLLRKAPHACLSPARKRRARRATACCTWREDDGCTSRRCASGCPMPLSWFAERPRLARRRLGSAEQGVVGPHYLRVGRRQNDHPRTLHVDAKRQD